MEIKMTEKQFRRLLDLVYIGNWILNSTRGDDRIRQYDEVESLVFSQCLAHGMAPLTELYQGQLIPSQAFAAQSIAVARELHFDMSKVNVNGGAISLGHPVGASGARIIVTLLHEMQKRPEVKRGLATLCIGGGMGVATIYEKC